MRAPFLALALLLGACSTTPTPATQPPAATVQEQRWRAAALTDYRYDFEQQCFCLREQTQPVTVEVRGGRVARVTSRETGQEVARSENLRWLTIDDLFRLTAGASVTYDPRLGYPTRIEIGSLAADAGVIYLASNLRPL